MLTSLLYRRELTLTLQRLILLFEIIDNAIAITSGHFFCMSSEL
ncbi:hypothetical protein [Sodalis-like endosymbiont of Proechinophthirus fluctus]|nr:hypothetical protein [Sodalis-like endosymbiont of Proechinophthirus fluctus]